MVDGQKSVEKRLDEYHTHTAKSVDYFRSQNKVIDVDGSLTPEEVRTFIFSHLTA